MLNMTGLAHNLVKNGLLAEAVLTQTIWQASLKQQSWVSLLIEQKLIDPYQIAILLAKSLGLPLLDLDRVNTGLMPLHLMHEKTMHAYQMLPLLQRHGQLFLATVDPTCSDKINEIRFHTGLNILIVVVESHKLKSALDALTKGEIAPLATQAAPATHLGELELAKLVAPTISLDMTDVDVATVNEAPLVRYLNKIINAAINYRASDIHFEPYESVYRIRYRRDGVLYEMAKLPSHLSSRFVARLKIMAELDISERRLPQDGRFKLQLSDNRTVDFRANSCPTLFGEKIVVRILDPNVTSLSIEALGFTPLQQQLFETAIKRPQGLVLVTGPTGSGKTVTQYSALTLLNCPEVNISTVEDPVEIYLPGINQVNINLKTGLSFACVLRALLRQDPDIIMVGEIRDTETAEIAVKAAQTGHLVLSTLHTNSAAETLTRLAGMGIAPFNLASAVKLIIAQRLVRRLCEQCKRPVNLPVATLLAEGFTRTELPKLQLYGAAGCHRCHKGYQGQLGVYEVMPVTPVIERVIMLQGTAFEITAAAKREGMMSLRRASLKKLAQGVTSLEAINSAVV